MNVQIKSSNGITTVPINTKLMTERKIFIEGEINEETACRFVKQVLLLSSENSEKPIDVFITSPGGEINSGLLIYDTIQGCKTPIRTFCMGRAFSMGAVLFACGNHGRYILPHSEVMLHEPLLGGKVGGNASSIRSISESLLETKKKLNQILAQHTGKTEEEIEEATKFDHYYSAEESVEFGLADKIVSFADIMEGNI